MMSTIEPELAATFRRLSERLYDTSVPMSVLDDEVTPYLDANVTFTDPWQHGGGIDRYRLGLAGFHSMFHFTLELKQASVTVDMERANGRAMVDAVMHLKPVAFLPSYPLRTILTYTFRLVPGDQAHPFRITAHEEMWSFGDMVAAVPGLRTLYGQVFRRGFTYAFLGASYLSARWKGSLPGPLGPRSS
jgi:hypothetical protein